MSVRRASSRKRPGKGSSEVEQPVTGASAATLPAVLDLTAAGPLAAELLRHRGTPLVLDGSGVERIGGQCLQVLLAARNAWAADGQNFCIDSPSDSLVETVAALGAAQFLMPLPEETVA